jgi:hypothetical protein
MALANLLLEKETVDGEEVYSLLGRPMPEDRRDAHAIAPARAAASAHQPSQSVGPDVTSRREG